MQNNKYSISFSSHSIDKLMKL